MNTTGSSPIRFTAEEFDGVFPFHFSLGPDGVLVEVGRSLQKISAAVRPGVQFSDAFVPNRPVEPFVWERLAAATNRLYTIRERATNTVLRGQFQLLEQKLFFLGTPWLSGTEELASLGLTLDDFAAHDPTLDLLQLLQLQKVVADDLQMLTARLKAQSVQVAEAARAKDVFLASMSHELRTPLTGILGMSEILAEQVHGPLNAKQLRDVSIVQTSGNNLLKLINGVIEMAKAGAGQIELKKQSCAIEVFCRPAFERLGPAAAARRQRLSIAIESPGQRVAVDPRRMTEVLVNLLGNASKFTAEGGECGLRVTATPREVRLEVWDHGIGINAADFPKLFQPFVQLDGRMARRHDGTGLGLALVKQWVDLHGGRVEVESEPGVGSRFIVVLARVDAACD